MTRIHSTAIAAATALTLCLGAPAAHAGCGDFNGDGNVTASDALAVLQVAIGTSTCDLVRCDVDGGGHVGAVDALMVLQTAVGQQPVFDCPSVAISDIDQLPLATGPVAGGDGLAALVSGVGAGGAETGINLSEMGPGTFDSQSSIAACEVSNITRNALNGAAEADRILCYVRNSFAALSDPSIDIYDGQPRTYALEFGTPPPGTDPEDAGGPSRVRMRMVRDDNGTIVDFEMFMCGDSPSGAVQDGYVRQTIDGPDFSMVSVNVRGESADQIAVTGSLNDAGQFVGSKLIQTLHDDVWGDGSGYGALELIQEADGFSLDGFDAGTFAHQGASGTYTHQLHAVAELLDGNSAGTPYALSLLAVGHGAARLRSIGTDSWGEWDHQAMQGWNGDTTRPDDDAAASFLDAVESATLVEVGSAPAIVFAEDQSYDCDDPIDAVVPIDMGELDQQCSALELGWEWVNCWDIIQPGDDGGEPCDGPECDDPCADGQCDPPCDGPDCEPHCEGGECGDPCWDESCDCNPEDPACFDACWNPECDDPCADGQCEPPCEGSDCEPPCEGPDCDPHCEGSDCEPPCEGPDCEPPCDGPDCDPHCEGGECGDPCWDESCDCNPEDPACFDECWNPECDDPCADGQCEPPCEGSDCEPPCEGPDCELPCEGQECGGPF